TSQAKQARRPCEGGSASRKPLLVRPDLRAPDPRRQGGILARCSLSFLPVPQRNQLRAHQSVPRPPDAARTGRRPEGQDARSAPEPRRGALTCRLSSVLGSCSPQRRPVGSRPIYGSAAVRIWLPRRPIALTRPR